MAPSSLSKPRTHTLPDDRALFLFGGLPRRKSSSSLSAAATTAGARRRTPSYSTSGIASAAPAPPLSTPPAPVTAPTTPSIHSAAATSLGPWGGTFLDAGPDADADTEGEDYYDAPETASDSDTGPAAVPASELKRISAKSEPSQTLRSQTAQSQSPPTLPPSLSFSNNARDSFISILDDPFFQRFHTSSVWLGNDDPSSDPATPSLPPEPSPSHLDDVPSGHNSLNSLTGLAGLGSNAINNTDNVQLGPNSDDKDKVRHDKSAWPPPRRESLTVTDQGIWPPPKKMDTINIAVIGTDGVGKSLFIQRALRLPKPPIQSITGIRMDVEGKPFIASMIELDLEHFDVDHNKKIHWPGNIGGHIMPHIDGALMLYDVMNKDSIRDLPTTLSALHDSGVPTILVATKCDNPEAAWQVNANALTNMFPSLVADFKTSAYVPSNMRDCLHAIVLAAVYNQKGGQKPDSNPATTTRRRAASSAAHLDTPLDGIGGGRPVSSEQGSIRHSRASSDLSLLRGGPSTSTDRESYFRTQNSRSPRIEYPSPLQLSSPSFRAEITDEKAALSVQGMLRSTGTRIDAGQDSFLDTEESDAESMRFPDDVTIVQPGDDLQVEKSSKTLGIPFDELVDRLLMPPMTRADSNFSDVFLCLYRKFAAPHQLLLAITSRLDKVWNDKSSHFLERTATQFRFIEVIARWVSLYPGDFARPSSRKHLESLVERLEDEPIFTLSAQQLRYHLENDITEDDDTNWAKCDEAPDADAASSASGAATPGTSGLDRVTLASDSMRSLTLVDSRSLGRPSSESGGVHGMNSGNNAGRSGFSHFQCHSYEDYEREAATMEPMGTLPLNKIRYHSFMEIDANDVADEMTRIDWTMFCSIRIRDFVRHVSLSPAEKERCRSLKNINRMIAHFNHVARWVAHMILIRDKAKHRAPCLQKFMVIAQRLRQLKNYNGLAAVLAGINGSAIHRLAQTRALVSPDVQKTFARLVLLMSSQKSHFTYRLAWENSPLPRIPFMPLHRRDLVSAEEGSRTFVGPQGDRINWKKFEVLGEVLLPIMKSQGTPYPNLKKHPQARDLILDCHMTMDEEEVYQRSVQVEPAGNVIEPRKKFPWLPK